MKFILISMISLSAFALPVLKSGRYECVSGKNMNMCPQVVKVILDDKRKMEALQVIYSGDCADQGPYYYDCQSDKFCDGPSVAFHIDKQAGGYFFENTDYDLSCTMKLIKK